MTKELQDLAWSVLPKEFKEETIRIYNLLVSYYNADNESGTRNGSSSCYGKIMLLRQLFGYNNLTSSAEGEEMLICHKEKVCEFYSHLLDLVEKDRTSKYYSEWCNLEREYISLFGDKPFAEYFKSQVPINEKDRDTSV